MQIKTKRLELKPIGADVGALVELLTDDVVKKTYMVPDFPDRDGANNMAQRIKALSEDPARNVAGIYLGAQLIGLLNQTEASGDSIEVGYALLPRFHGQGYATEALTGAIEYFFRQGFREVTAGAFEENAASIRVMVKSGMRRMEKSDEVAYRGKNHRCVYYQAQRP